MRPVWGNPTMPVLATLVTLYAVVGVFMSPPPWGGPVARLVAVAGMLAMVVFWVWEWRRYRRRNDRNH